MQGSRCAIAFGRKLRELGGWEDDLVVRFNLTCSLERRNTINYQLGLAVPDIGSVTNNHFLYLVEHYLSVEYALAMFKIMPQVESIVQSKTWVKIGYSGQSINRRIKRHSSRETPLLEIVRGIILVSSLQKAKSIEQVIHQELKQFSHPMKKEFFMLNIENIDQVFERMVIIAQSFDGDVYYENFVGRHRY